MIDTETLDIGENSVMIQLAGVYFDRYTGNKGESFCKSINIQDCLDQGFTVGGDTLNWWLTQKHETLKSILNKAEPLGDTIWSFSHFVNNADFIWSHATFDFPLVQNYLKTLRCKELPFRGARDIRTLVDLSSVDLNNYDWDRNTHDALDDCNFQIDYCVDALNMLKGVSVLNNFD